MRCPCSTGLPYDECCGPIHRGERAAPTAEQLMRSRFSGFALGDVSYLLASWHPSTRPSSLELETELRWYRLDIEHTADGGPLDRQGIVAFTAHCRSPDGPGRQHEVSAFRREGAAWFYLGPLSP